MRFVAVNFKLLLLFFIILFSFNSCKNEGTVKSVKSKDKEIKSTPVVKNLKVRIIREIPHATVKTYTQGFELYNGILYESTGLKNQSALKQINPENGDIIKMVDIESIFAEGITIMNNQITMLSYRRGIALTYDLETLEEKGISFTYDTEGWGLTNDGKHLIMSDGSNKLYYRDPFTLKLMKTLKVKYNNIPLNYLNELEYANGKIYANIYGKEYIVAIDPETGMVVEDINAANVSCSQLSISDPEAVLNGIAYNKETGTFFITGKKCQKIYEVTFQ